MNMNMNMNMNPFFAVEQFEKLLRLNASKFFV